MLKSKIGYKITFYAWNNEITIETPSTQGGSRESPSVNRTPPHTHTHTYVCSPAARGGVLSKHYPAPRHCKPRPAGANTVMKAPIVQHLCKGFVLRFLWGQGVAESQLTHNEARVKLRSFDSLRVREHICSAHPQQPGEQCSIRIPCKESSVHRASKVAAPEGDAVLPGGLPDGEVPSCGS